MIRKVCGMRDAKNISEVDALGIDLMGFIFWTKSSRYVNPEDCPTIPMTRSKRVGVFVNEAIEQVTRISDKYALDYIQLHGQESPEYCTQLRGRHLIKAFNIATPDDLQQTLAYTGIVDLFLFDTKGKSVGGNGEKFDWSVLSAYDGNMPFLLSGGIGPDDAGSILSFHHPKCIGIDLNSRFELAPGLKDVSSLSHFLSQLSK